MTHYDKVDDLAKATGCQVQFGPLGRPMYSMTATELIQFAIAFVQESKSDVTLQAILKD